MPDSDHPIDHSHLTSWSDDELTDAWRQLAPYAGTDPYIVAARDGVAREREFRRVLRYLPDR